MTSASRARAQATVVPQGVPHALEVSYAQSVERIVKLIEAESLRLEKKAAATAKGLDTKDVRVLIDLARALQSLHSGTLWGARAILAKQSTAGTGEVGK